MKIMAYTLNKVRYGALLALMLPIYYIVVILAFIINLKSDDENE